MLVEIVNEKEYIDMRLTSEEVSAIKREIERYLGDGKVVEFDELIDGFGGSASFEEFEGEIVEIKKEENGDILVYVQGKVMGTFYWEEEDVKEKKDEMYVWYTLRVPRGDTFESVKIIEKYYEFWIDEYWEE